MATFTYSAQNDKGEVIEGTLEAKSEVDAIADVQKRGLLVLAVKENAAQADGKAAPKDLSFTESFFAKKPAASDMIFLAEQMALLLRGGVPLLDGITLLANNVSSPVLAATLHKIAEEVTAGTALSQAVAKYPSIFDPIWTSMVEAGEASGELPKTLEEISNYLNQKDSLRSKVITAFMYPTILMGTSLFVLIFFIVRIVPVFTQIFDSFKLKLPPLTIAVVAVSDVMKANLLTGIIAIIIASIIFKAYFKTDSGQWFKAKFLLGLPVIGKFLLNLMCERFLMNFALLLRSGVNVLNALSIMEKLFSTNKPFAQAVSLAAEKIREGGTMGQGFAQTKLFPNLAIQMMKMGEESGKLPEIMETLAGFYRRQVEQFIQRISSIIDPIMVLGVGVIVTIIVMAVFLPIFELTQIGTGG
ncbi:type II secretion system F family protein [Elusimicrobiota bacterium]